MHNGAFKITVSPVQIDRSAVIIKILIAITGFFGIDTKMMQDRINICPRTR